MASEKTDALAVYKGSCHCGRVGFELTGKPRWLTECNCSICSRIAARWAHSEIDNVRLHYAEGATLAYVWGDKTLALHSCKHCGCTTHWQSLEPEKYSRMAVNFRMCTDLDLSEFRIRHFDGADSWEFLD